MLGDIEDVAHQIALLIGSNRDGINGSTFAENLAAIDAEKNDGVTTTAPIAEQIFEAQKASVSANGFPACQIIAGRTAFAQDDNPTLQEGTHRLTILWLHLGDDEVTVAKQIQRLVRATRMTLWGSTFDGLINAAPLLVQDEDYSDLAPVEGSAFLKGGRSIVLVPTLVQ